MTAATHYMAGPQQVTALPERLPAKDRALALANMLAEFCGEGALTTVQTVVISPGMHRVFAAEGWSKADLKRHLIENVKVSVGSMKRRHHFLAETSETPEIHGSAPIYAGDDEKFIHMGKGERFGRVIGGHETTRPQGDVNYLLAVAGADTEDMYACFFRPYIPDGAMTMAVRSPAKR